MTMKKVLLGAAGLIPYLGDFMTMVPKLIGLGVSAVDMATHVKDMVTKGGPTQEDWDRQRSGEDALRAHFLAGAAPRAPGT